MAYKDYEMKVCELEEALRLSDIRKDHMGIEIDRLKKELEQARQCLSFKESAKLIAVNKELRLTVKDFMTTKEDLRTWRDEMAATISDILGE